MRLSEVRSRSFGAPASVTILYRASSNSNEVVSHPGRLVFAHLFVFHGIREAYGRGSADTSLSAVFVYGRFCLGPFLFMEPDPFKGVRGPTLAQNRPQTAKTKNQRFPDPSSHHRPPDGEAPQAVPRWGSAPHCPANVDQLAPQTSYRVAPGPKIQSTRSRPVAILTQAGKLIHPVPQ